MGLGWQGGAVNDEAIGGAAADEPGWEAAEAVNGAGEGEARGAEERTHGGGVLVMMLEGGSEVGREYMT